MTYQPKHRKPTVDDWLHDYFNKISEKNKIKYKDREKDHCVEYEDCMDGYVIHTSICPHYQDMAISGSTCINFSRN